MVKLDEVRLTEVRLGYYNCYFKLALTDSCTFHGTPNALALDFKNSLVS